MGGRGVYVPREILAENLPRRRRENLRLSCTAASQEEYGNSNMATLQAETVQLAE